MLGIKIQGLGLTSSGVSFKDSGFERQASGLKEGLRHG